MFDWNTAFGEFRNLVQHHELDYKQHATFFNLLGQAQQESMLRVRQEWLPYLQHVPLTQALSFKAQDVQDLLKNDAYILLNFDSMGDSYFVSQLFTWHSAQGEKKEICTSQSWTQNNEAYVTNTALHAFFEKLMTILPSRTHFMDDYATGDPGRYSSLVGQAKISLDQYGVPVLAYQEVYWEYSKTLYEYPTADYESFEKFYQVVRKEYASSDLYDLDIDEDDDVYRVNVSTIDYANVNNKIIQESLRDHLSSQIEQGQAALYDLRLLGLCEERNEASIMAT